ncbi:biotin/lipoyl-binding protein, partial [bacterium]|nr:biotin/lipoyl-binding protein [bacterium]
MKRRNIIIIAAVVLVVAIGAVLITQANARQNQNSLYQTAVISKGDLTAFVGATGRVRPNQSTQISWQTSGRVESIQVEIGDLVESGQILANLSDASLSQSIILSEADLVTARRNLEDLKTSEVARANAQLALVKAQDALDDAQKSRNRKDYTRSSQENLDIARSNYIISEDGVRKAQ